MLRNEEQVMHERQLSRTSKKLEDKLTVEQSLIELLCVTFLEDCGQWAAVGGIRRFLKLLFFFLIHDISVDFNTVQVTNMDQFHNFVF